jgi:cell division septal protein FtsQ
MQRKKADLFGRELSRRRKSVYFGLLFFWAAIILVLIFLWGSLRLLGGRLDFFKVREIIVRENVYQEGPVGIDLAYLKGRNIFSINLERESAYLSRLYPDYKQVRLFRLFPSRLVADFIKRRPIAYVKLYRLFYLSDELVLFSVPAGIADSRLPVITGLERKIPAPQSGSRYACRELVLALKVMREVRLNQALGDYKIKRIHAASLDNFSFYLLYAAAPQPGLTLPEVGLLEVKVNAGNLRDKINILAGLLNRLKNQRQMLSYIDLRFKDPVIKLNREE